MFRTHAGIDLYAETDPVLTCDYSELSWCGLSLGPSWGVPRTGNIVRGSCLPERPKHRLAARPDPHQQRAPPACLEWGGPQ